MNYMVVEGELRLGGERTMQCTEGCLEKPQPWSV